ncbi:MAG TPA: SUMF1/EgtB/PvdO family nonheme iron enzyme, partial [Aggregatilineales bacterium]|nr:SUMF1/EgtB/PvdO family nonheme iron enzyme [Aggregatilineales bacterium]
MVRSSFDLLPQPFAWMPISAGKVKVISIISKEGNRENYIPIRTSKVFDVSAFEMAKYPVTNAQFSKFVDANGYAQRQWWTDEGWEARTQGLKVPLWDGSSPDS